MVFYSQKLLNLPHIKHGFFSKELNIGDKALYEKESLRQIKDHLKGSDIICLRQKHSSVCHLVNQMPEGRLTGDALVTQKEKLVLCVKTGDCAPILIAHKTKNIIAAIHAGWKGAILEKVIENTVDLLKKKDSISNYVVALGPCLHQKNFEVGSVIYNNVVYKKYFINQNRYFDFPLFIQDKLEQLGFCDVDNINLDTYTNEKDFFSFRRNTHRKEDATGRQGSAIVIV